MWFGRGGSRISQTKGTPIPRVETPPNYGYFFQKLQENEKRNGPGAHVPGSPQICKYLVRKLLLTEFADGLFGCVSFTPEIEINRSYSQWNCYTLGDFNTTEWDPW